MEITVSNVNQALARGLDWLRLSGIKEDSRNGPVLVSPEPVLTVYQRPLERVLFSPLRDANPFFHFFESIWMLAGRDDLAWPLYFNKNFAAYSDDGVTCHGAYGYRWRKALGYDQLEVIAGELHRNPNSRRCVLQMWDAADFSVEIDGYNPRLCGSDDLQLGVRGGKDVPCNTHAYFTTRDGYLDMTVCQRSGDCWWGVYGANAVHMSTLLEYMAFAAELKVGVYRQFCNNFHVYTDVVTAPLDELARDAESHDEYENLASFVRPYPLINTSVEIWNDDLIRFMSEPLAAQHYRDSFFAEVAVPMYAAWHQRKQKKGTGLMYSEAIAAEDWRIACTQWIERRENGKRAAAAADTPRRVHG